MCNNLELALLRTCLTVNVLFYIMFYRIKNYDFQFKFAVVLSIIILLINIIQMIIIKKNELRDTNIEFIGKIISFLLKISIITGILNLIANSAFSDYSSSFKTLFVEIIFLFSILVFTFFESVFLRILFMILCLFLTYLIFGNSVEMSKNYTIATAVAIIVIPLLASSDKK